MNYIIAVVVLATILLTAKTYRDGFHYYDGRTTHHITFP
jgi:hypothetical protein